MRDFNFHNPTKILFGKNKIEVLASQLKKNNASKVLLVYGKGSIKKIGLYDKVISILKENNIFYEELSGILPNPRISSVRKGIKICKKNNIDFVLAVGGGSVIDASKAIAAGFYYDKDPWDLCLGKARVSNALKIGTILTLAATGSEMNGNAVISNEKTNQKLAIHSPKIIPTFSILDPTYTFSVPKNQTAAGIVDIMSHVFEQYFSPNNDAFITDSIAEGILKTCIKYGKIVLNEPENYEARANILWASTLALNGLLTCGKITDWATHIIEHEVSAYYDITHGIGLGIITPRWMRYVLDENNKEKFCILGKNLFNIENDGSIETANNFIDKLHEFFIELGIPKNFSEIGIKSNKYFDAMANNIEKIFNTIGNFKKLKKEDIIKILNNCL